MLCEPVAVETHGMTTMLIHCGGCGRSWPEDTLPHPLHNGICRDCSRIHYAPAATIERLRREIGRAVVLFEALGHDGNHDRCDPCRWVRHARGDIDAHG